MSRRPPTLDHAPVPTVARRLAVLAVAGLVVSSFAGQALAAELSPFDAATQGQARSDLVALVNARRVAVGLVALRLDATTAALAQQRADTIAATDTISHSGPDGLTVFDAIRAAGI